MGDLINPPVLCTVGLPKNTSAAPGSKCHHKVTAPLGDKCVHIFQLIWAVNYVICSLQQLLRIHSINNRNGGASGTCRLIPCGCLPTLHPHHPASSWETSRIKHLFCVFPQHRVLPQHSTPQGKVDAYVFSPKASLWWEPLRAHDLSGAPLNLPMPST